MGKVSTHAVIYARLITDGQDHGVHGNYEVAYLKSFFKNKKKLKNALFDTNFPIFRFYRPTAELG